MIEVRGLTKRYGSTLAVDDLSFDVLPGRVTGFLGPNGAGKSTTMRMILGLDRPTAGSALIDGKPYSDLVQPLRTVGALLDYLPSIEEPEVAEQASRTLGEVGVKGGKPDPLLLTALGDVTTEVASLEAGARGYLTKPFSSMELLDRVEELLRQ